MCVLRIKPGCWAWAASCSTYGVIWNGQPAPDCGGPVKICPVGCPPTTGPRLTEFTIPAESVYCRTQPFCPQSDAGMYGGRLDGMARHQSYHPALGNRP